MRPIRVIGVICGWLSRLHGYKYRMAFPANEKQQRILAAFCKLRPEFRDIANRLSIDLLDDVAGHQSSFRRGASVLDFSDHDAFGICRQVQLRGDIRRDVGNADAEMR